ncbi:MAG: MBL fold metallo-hydrolase [Dehalococcoidia bacterium]
MPDRGTLELAFVGSGNAFAPQRCWSGFLLDQRHLFDAPPTALYGLKQLGADLAVIDTVFISHFHADHFFGLPFLLLEYAYLTRRSGDLTIAGPPGIEERVRKLTELGYPSLLTRDLGFTCRYVEVENGFTAAVNGLRVSAVEVEHGGEALQSYGFRVETAGRTLAYTGDTTYCDQLLELGSGADVLVADCTYANGKQMPEHMSFDEVQELQQRLGGTTEFVLTHLGGNVDTRGAPRITVATDRARLRF